jgi:hypothetical protein
VTRFRPLTPGQTATALGPMRRYYADGRPAFDETAARDGLSAPENSTAARATPGTTAG